ncbi:MAG: hypothetical protein DWQ34_04650 [Planctomycetota bacterium]|nr:MAG: hypothetical protein DWQ34_04650 [Planctomycetota bacterium]REK32420.1 MAG: hypothetical protein DWQ45_17225 [Planctomycetota bacterium]
MRESTTFEFTRHWRWHREPARGSGPAIPRSAGPFDDRQILGKMLNRLHSLKQLNSLSLANTDVTENGVVLLLEPLPDCEITRNGGTK